MRDYKYIIIGGGIAGTTAAETIREKDKIGTIAIIGDESYPLYSRVLLPNFLKNRAEKERVFLRREDSYDKKKIDTFFGKKVARVDFKNKELSLSDNQSLSYEKLLIASGGRVKKFEINGVDSSDIYHFQSIDDAVAIKEKMLSIKKAVVLGGSFIALELAESFHLNGKETNIILRGDGFWKGIMDKESNDIIIENIKEKGVNLFLNEEIESGKYEDGKKVLISKSKREHIFDILAVGVGIDRNIEFLDNSQINIKKGIVANEYLETNIEDVFTAGDVAEFYDLITDRYQIYGNWPASFLHGRIAGINMTIGQAGEKTACRHISGYNIVNFGLNISFIGDVMRDENTIVIKRGNVINKEHSQIFIRKNLLVGATGINMNRERSILAVLIDNKINLVDNLDNLKDVNFDLKILINK